MQKVLIVTPNWPPVSCPDLHRVRMALPYFAEFGWEPLILKINPAEQEGIKDPDLCRTVPDRVKTWQAGCLPLWATKWIGLRNVGLRSYFHLARLGDRIIQEVKPKVVFFSTTMFPVMTLGRYWHKRHGLSHVLDFQDPWFKEQRKKECRPENAEDGERRPLTTDHRPPTLKGRLANQVAGILEPFALRRVSHVVSVSPGYVDLLRSRYAWLDKEDFTVLPFGAAEGDYEMLHASPARQTIFDPRDGRRHWIYVGRGGGDMSFSLRAFFSALQHALASQPEIRVKLRLHFIGTSYAPKGRAAKTVEPLAAESGLGDLVNETTDRIPYFEALQCLLDADALFAPGSDDPGYTASKIYPYILAQKPLLAVFHEQSSVVDVLKKTRAGTVVTFKTGEGGRAVAGRLLESGWLQAQWSVPSGQQSAVASPATDWTAFTPYTAREMTRRLCEVFDNTAAGNRRPTVGRSGEQWLRRKRVFEKMLTREN